MDILSQATDLPQMDTFLQESNWGSWAKNGKLQQSITCASRKLGGNTIFDALEVLLPFFRVRNVLCANTHVPEGAKQNLHHFVEHSGIKNDDLATLWNISRCARG